VKRNFTFEPDIDQLIGPLLFICPRQSAFFSALPLSFCVDEHSEKNILLILVFIQFLDVFYFHKLLDMHPFY
jgi:hypothetical protein